jgi:hypothetical protein
MGQLVGFEIVVLRMVPVYNGMIEADLETFIAGGIDDLPAKVATDKIMGIIGSILGFEETKAVVVLAREDHVLTTGLAGKLRPFARKALFGPEKRDRLVCIFPCVCADALLDPFHTASLADRFVLPGSGKA